MQPPPSLAATLRAPASLGPAAEASASSRRGSALLAEAGASSSGGADSSTGAHWQLGAALRRAPRRGGLLGGLASVLACFGGGAGSRRLRDTAVHAGPVTAIVIRGGRAYTAGGATKAAAALLVWDARRGELLRTTSRRSTSWLRSPVAAAVPVVWGRVGRGVAGGVEMHIVTGHWNGQVRAVGGVGAAAWGPDLGLGLGSSKLLSVDQRKIQPMPTDANRRQPTAPRQIILWDPTGDTLRPVLVLGQARGAVNSLAVIEELGLLAAGHVTGKVGPGEIDRVDAVAADGWRVAAS
jgi:hypothetical protein